MNCPRDGAQLETKRIDVGIDVDLCPSCGGYWLDKGELEALQARHVNDHAGKRLTDPDDVAGSFDMARQEQQPAASCPKCNEVCERAEYGMASQVIVDRCPQGHGLWLDAGELEALEVYFERLRRESHEPMGLAGLWATLMSVFE